ncbi:hypothetical protein [Acidovorax sp. BL-A-41-H1]|uniref:hypothetical protein n=1 Tax=Acidovorax sp. BL-A-41-H1 TaxID=3421102 RepID=UPI003F7B234F
MTNHPLTTKPAAPGGNTPAPDLAARVAALELFAQQLVLVLDAEGVMNADALTRWMSLARARMLETGSVPAAHVHALAQLQRLVMA